MNPLLLIGGVCLMLGLFQAADVAKEKEPKKTPKPKAKKPAKPKAVSPIVQAPAVIESIPDVVIPKPEPSAEVPLKPSIQE